ncbi:ninein isoform X2 [Engraulis encrasicolus]|uniref:ninein isoform X2 n=1 Tax=Engraulis encrasicolus TaxID=184585 RepID=UPI002FD6DD00
MDESQQDLYEERLKELFHSFDGSGAGSLTPEELADLCQALQLQDAEPVLLETLVYTQDQVTGRVDFEQFKNALILVLSAAGPAGHSGMESEETMDRTAVMTTTEAVSAPVPPLSLPMLSSSAFPALLRPSAGSPEVQAKFVRGSKRYGRRSIPEFTDSFGHLEADCGFDCGPPLGQVRGAAEAQGKAPAAGEDGEAEADHGVDNQGNSKLKVHRKLERWYADASGSEEYEAEGQLQLWNPDEPTTPSRKLCVAISERQEERLRTACEDLGLPWDQPATQEQLLHLCQHLGLELSEELLPSLDVAGEVSVLDFMRCVMGQSQSQPPTPSSSTPYRQLKRHHSLQPFDESGRRTSVVQSTIGLRLFSTLDDGTGHTAAEELVDAWMDEGIDNSIEILAALEFSLDGRVNLSELTLALENELLMTKNSVHRAALASFKAEIRHLLERVDLELREKERIRSDLEKAEKLKTQLASEVDEHHSAIERHNELNLRKLEQEHREKLCALRSELTREMDRLQQQAGQQREELEAEITKIREDETFMREHLTITVKENGRLEKDLLDSSQRLLEAENQASKLQKNLDDILKEKFGDLDPASAELFLQEDRLRQLRNSYELKCRELQDRIDELQVQLEEFQVVGRAPQPSSLLSLAEEFESKSPGTDSDQGLGPEEGQPFNMSLETEMILEQLKEQHFKDMKNIQTQVNEYQQLLQEQQRVQEEAQEELRSTLSVQHQEEVHSLRDELDQLLMRAEKLQGHLDEVKEERLTLEENHIEEQEALERRHKDAMASLQQQLQEALTQADELQDQLNVVEARHAEARKELESNLTTKIHELEQQQENRLHTSLEEERRQLLEQLEEQESEMFKKWQQEKELFRKSHEMVLASQLQAAREVFEEESKELQRRLTANWEEEKGRLEELHKEALETLLAEERVTLHKQQEQRETALRQQWDEEIALLEKHHEDSLQDSLARERERLKAKEEEIETRLSEEFERERAQLEEQHDRDLQDTLEEERFKHRQVKEEAERMWQEILEEEKTRLEESHREALQELSTKHSEERERHSSLLDKLKEDIAVERRELQSHFSQRINEVEARFSGDQEAVSDRIQADIHNLEQHYQSELQALSKLQAEEKNKWESDLEAASKDAEMQQKAIKEAFQLENKFLVEKLAKEHEDLEAFYKEDMEAMRVKNEELEKELEYFISVAQSKEIELSRQLNELHDRLQENLDSKDALLSQSDKKIIEMELLFRHAKSDFEQQRIDLEASLSDLESRHIEALNLAEKQLEENRQLLEERDGLKAKVLKAEQLLRLAAINVDIESLELQCSLTELQGKLKQAQTGPFCSEQAEARQTNLDQCSRITGKWSKLKVDEVWGASDDIVFFKLRQDSQGFKYIEEEVLRDLAVPIPEETSEELALESCADELHTSDEGKEDRNKANDALQAHLSETGANACEKKDAEIVKYTSAVVCCTEEEDPKTGHEAVPKEELEQDDMERISEYEHSGLMGVEAHGVETDEICDAAINTEHSHLSEDIIVEAHGNGDELNAVDGQIKVDEVDEDVFDTTGEVANAQRELNNYTKSDAPKAEVEDVNRVALDAEVVVTMPRHTKVGDSCTENVEDSRAVPRGMGGDFEGIRVDEVVGIDITGTCINVHDEACSAITGGDIASTEVIVGRVENVDVTHKGFGKGDNENHTFTVETEEVEMITLETEFEDMSIELVDEELADTEIQALDTDAITINAERLAEKVTAIWNVGGRVGLDDAEDIELATEEEPCIDKANEDALVKRIKELESEVESMASLKEDCALTVRERDACVKELLKLQDRLGQFYDQSHLLSNLRAQCQVATDDNSSLKQHVIQLQQRIDELEVTLEGNRADLATGQGVLGASCDLQLELSTMIEQAKELEIKALELTDLQIRYEKCVCENVRLASRNEKLETRMISLESKMHIIQDLHGQHSALLDEIERMREENSNLSSLVHTLVKQNDSKSLENELRVLLQGHTASSGSSSDSNNLELSPQMEAVADLEECCSEFERQNSKLRRALSDLQDRSFQIRGRMQVQRSKAGRLAEENVVLRRKISSIKEEENREDMLLKLDQFRKEKVSAQKVADSLKNQISELRAQSQQLEQENRALSQTNSQNVADVEELSVQLRELIQQSERREAGHQHSAMSPSERNEMVACVSSLEEELKKVQKESAVLQQEKASLSQQLSSLHGQLNEGGDDARTGSKTQRLEEEKALLKEELACCVEKVAKLGTVEERLSQLQQERQAADKQVQTLRSQLSKAQEKHLALESTLQMMNLQTSRLKSDLRVTQQERDSLKQDVLSLHQKLQNANDKVQLLEVSLAASGFPSPQRQLLSGELRRLLEQDQTLLLNEKERLQRELQHTKTELHKTRDKSRQLEASVVSLKQRQQQSQVGLLKVVEQEKASLRRELDALRNQLLISTTNKKACDHSDEHRQLDTLRQENAALKTRQSHLEAQLFEALQVQLGGILPQSPVRLPGERRGQHRGDDHGPDFNIQDEQERKMLKMEDRMREVELMLKNVKMLLQTKVSQLKDQLHKNNKADDAIKDLCRENAQLMAALQQSEQRHKMADKKNFLLEEKISSLNKIVRELGPSPLSPIPYTFTPRS